VTAEASQAVETFLRSGYSLRQQLHRRGRLMVRFATWRSAAARDAVNDQLKDTYITALSFAPRTPAALRALGLRRCRSGSICARPVSALSVDVNAAVSQALEGYAQDARRALAAATSGED